MPDAIVKRMTMVVDNLKYAVGGYFKAQFKIECWIYILLVIGLMILGVDYAFLVAFGIRSFRFPAGFRHGDGDGAVGGDRAFVGKLQDDVRSDCHMADRAACAAGDPAEDRRGCHGASAFGNLVFAVPGL